MITLSIAEFENLVSSKNWKREQDYDVLDRSIYQVEEYDEETDSFNLIDIPHVFGLAFKTSTLKIPAIDLTVTYTEGFNYDEGKPESLSVGTEGQDEVWAFKGVRVVDEEGDELSPHELADYLTTEFSYIDYDILNIVNEGETCLILDTKERTNETND